MNAASTAVANFSLSFPMDFTGAGARIFAAFQQIGATRAGQRGHYLRNVVRQMRLNVAGLDRIQPWSPAVFREFTHYWKNIRGPSDLTNPDTLQEVFTLTFGGKEALQPAGTLSFSRAAIPELRILFANTPIDSRTQSRELLLLVYLETWEVLEIKEGKGRVFVME